MEELEKKYIDLILGRCLNFNQSKSLMINCELKEHLFFAEKIKKQANKMGIFDVCIHVNDLDEVHEYLKNTKTEDIKVNPIIDRTDWNTYALKGAALLFIDTKVPGLMEDIPEEKIIKYTQEKEKTIPYYRKHVTRYTFPWCIMAMPNERWAKSIFGNCENAYEKLYLNIMRMCMVDKQNPIEEWEKYIKQSNYYKDKLNELGIKTLHFTNSLGTDLTVGIPEGNIWINMDKTDANGGQMLPNLPSYEIFTSPDYRKTNGIVYSSKPLYYNDCRIDEFNLTFKDGKIVSCHAKKGEKLLNKLIFENKNAIYLGEIAIVPVNSPIANTGLVFNSTLFDENSSNHAAIGNALTKCFKNYQNLSEEELIEKGLNVSEVHVDFMFGTNDMDIVAETSEGRKLIFKNGNFII